MSFNVLELHWFHKNYEDIERLNLKNDLIKVFGPEKTNILFSTKNHPQIKEILNNHPEVKEPDMEPEYLKVISNELLNQLRSRITQVVSFDKILESSTNVNSFDSLWFLPSIIIRPEFYDNIESIIRTNIYELSISFYVKLIVFLIRKNPGAENLVKIYNTFKEKYILIGSSAASSSIIEDWSQI